MSENSLRPSQPWRLGISLAKTTEMLLSDQLNQLDVNPSFRLCSFAMSSFTHNYYHLMGASPTKNQTGEVELGVLLLEPHATGKGHRVIYY